MNKNIFYIILCCIFLLGACKDDEKDPALSVNVKNLEFVYNDGGTQSVTVTSDASLINAAPEDEWCVVAVKKAAGGFTLNITVDENMIPEGRNTVITVAPAGNDRVKQEIQVVQGPGPVIPVLSVRPILLNEIPAIGDTVEITVTTNIEYEYTCDADWLKITPSGDRKKLTVIVSENDVPKVRDTKINFTGGELTAEVIVQQKAKVFTMSFDPTSLTNVPKEGSVYSVTLKTNARTFIVESTVTWISVTQDAVNPKLLTVTVDPNPDNTARTGGRITCRTDEHTITAALSVSQLGYIISVDPISIRSIPKSGGNYSVALTTNAATVQINAPGWATVTPGSDNTYNIAVAANSDASIRNGDVVFTVDGTTISATLSISQLGNEQKVPLTVSQLSSNAPYNTLANLVDGIDNVSGNYDGTTTVKAARPHYIDIALDEALPAFKVRYVVGLSPTYRPTGIEIMASTDGNDWVSMETISSGLPTTLLGSYLTQWYEPTSPVKYIRFKINSGNHSTYCLLAELEVYKDSTR